MTCKKPEKQSLKKIDICKICFNKIEDNSFHSILSRNHSICFRCYKQTKPRIHHFKINGINALALYDYEDPIKERLFQFKGCYDYELKDTFLEYFIFYLKLRYFNYVLVPAPSSEISNQNRGFNHVIEMYKILGLKMHNCIHKTNDIKQSDLSMDERLQIGKFLSIENGEFLHNKNVLIVDDVLTTGSTIKSIINLVQKYNPKKIKVLVLCKTIFDKKTH